MDDRDYDAAIRQEAAWLDQQLVQHVVDALSTRQLDGKVTLSASVLAAIDTAFAQAAARHAPVAGGVAPPDRSPTRGFGLANVPDRAESILGVAEVPEQSDGTWPSGTGPLDEAVAPATAELAVPKGRLPLMHAIVLLLLLASVCFAGWQMMRATGYKNQVQETAARKKTLREIQTKADAELCATGYPAVMRAIRSKVEKNEERSDTEKTVLAFYAFRQDVAIANGSSAVDDGSLRCPNNAVTE